MSTEERRVQLAAEVDTTRTRAGFQEIGQQAGQMAQQVTQAGERAEQAVNQVGQQANAAAQQVSRAGQQAAGAVGNIGSNASTSTRNVDSASRSIISSIQRATAAAEAGGRQTAQYYEVIARQRGIDPNALRPYLDQLRAVEKAQGSAGVSAEQTTAAMRQLPAQMSDIVSSLAGGQSPFMVLIQQGGQIKDSFGGVRNAIQSIGGEVKSFFGITSSGAESLSSVSDVLSDIIGQQDSAAQSGANLADGLGGAADSANSLAEAGANAQEALAGVTRTTGILIAGGAAVAAVVAALVYAYREGSKEADAYTRSIIESANAAGVSTSQLSSYAAAISKTVGTQAEAAKVVAALTSSGQVGAENMKQFGTVAVEVQKYIGRSVEDTIKDFTELGKSPVESIVKLDDSYHFLTASVYEQIKALQEQGKNDDAAELAQKTYAAAFADRAAKMKDNLGLIERAWMGAKDSAASAWDVFLGVGRKKTPAQELAEVQAQIALARQPAGTGAGDRGDAAEMRRVAAASKLTELLKRESEIQKQIDKDAQDAQAAAGAEKLRQAKLTWGQIMDTTVSQAQKQRDEIKAVTQKGIDAGASQEDINKAIAKVKEKYFAINNATLTQLENNRNLQKEKMVGELADVEAQYKLQQISQEKYLAKKRDIQLREIDLEIPIIKEQARIADGKEEKSAREKANGELAVLMQRRANIIKGADNDAQVADANRKKAIDNLVGGWDRAIAAQAEAAEQELSLFGKSGQARQVAIAQIKLETEARKFIADQAKDDHALSEQEITDLNARTEAKKRELAVVMNREAAIAGARELRDANRKFTIDYVFDSEERARRTLEIDAEEWRERINNAEEGSAARKLIEEQFDVWMANRQMQPVLDRWKGVIDNLDNNFQEGFRDMLTSGKPTWSSFAKSIGNTLKTSLADALYQVFIKKYVVSIVTGLAGGISGAGVADALAGGGGTAADTTGAGSLIGAAQTAAGLYKVISGGFAGISSAVGSGISSLGSAVGSQSLSAFGGGMQGFGLDGSLGAAGGYGATAGQFVSGAAGAVAGHYIGNAIAGDYSINHGQAVTNIASVTGAILGGPIGGAIGGAIGGLINRAFGMGSKETQTTGISGDITASGLTASSYAKYHQDGGWFRSDKNGTDSKSLSTDALAAIANGLSQIKAVSSSFATSIGADASTIASYTKSFNIDLGKDGKIEEGVTKLLSSVGDELATRLVPNIAQFTKSGETASSTLERLAGDFNATTQMAQLLGKTATEAFGAAGLASAEARERLVTLAGSASNLTSWASSYAQNYLTEQEKLAPVKRAVDAAMSSLGLASVTTRDEFKRVVASLDLTTEAGAKQFTSMMQLADAFAQVHAVTETLTRTESDIASERASLQDQLDQLTMTSTQLLKKQRDALAEANRPLFDMVQAAQKLADTSSSLTTFRDSVRSLSDSLSTGSLSVLTPEQQEAELKSQYEKIRTAAMGGDTTAQGKFSDALTAWLTASQKLNAGDTQYQADFSQGRQDAAAAASWATGQIDAAQAQLNSMNSQTLALQGMNNTLTAANKILDTIAQNTSPAPIQSGFVLSNALSVLSSAVKLLKENSDKQQQEVAGLRKDQQTQTGDAITANAEAQQQSAQTIVSGMSVLARVFASNQKVTLE